MFRKMVLFFAVFLSINIYSSEQNYGKKACAGALATIVSGGLTRSFLHVNLPEYAFPAGVTSGLTAVALVYTVGNTWKYCTKYAYVPKNFE